MPSNAQYAELLLQQTEASNPRVQSDQNARQGLPVDPVYYTPNFSAYPVENFAIEPVAAQFASTSRTRRLVSSSWRAYRLWTDYRANRRPPT